LAKNEGKQKQKGIVIGGFRKYRNTGIFLKYKLDVIFLYTRIISK